MKITATLNETYIPEWNGNRELEPSDQVSVKLKWPTAEQQSNLKEVRWGSDGDMRFKFDTKRILSDHVAEITGLEVELNGKAASIKTGTDLLNTRVLALQPLISELCRVVASEDGLEEEEEKN